MQKYVLFGGQNYFVNSITDKTAEVMKSKKPLAFFGGVFALILTLVTSDSRNEVFRDCTRELYDRVVRFEYLYYEGYWMYPYNKLRNQGPSFHYTEKDFCEYCFYLPIYL